MTTSAAQADRVGVRRARADQAGARVDQAMDRVDPDGVRRARADQAGARVDQAMDRADQVGENARLSMPVASAQLVLTPSAA
jgi:hypothetical protein